MDDERPSGPERSLDGYAHGPDATVVAMADALERTATAESIVFVEGISDVIALEAIARRTERNLDDVVVLPINGAQAISRVLHEFSGTGRRLSGLCDAGEEDVYRRALVHAGLGSPSDRCEMEELGFFVCVDDLEDELIRAAAPGLIEDLLDEQGELGSFRTLQKQAVWRDRPFEAQMHRWLRAGARRNLRYARLLVDNVDVDRIPQPLVAVLDAARLG